MWLLLEIESWKEKLFKLDERLIDLEDEFDSEANLRKRKICKERQDDLSKNIDKVKKRCKCL